MKNVTLLFVCLFFGLTLFSCKSDDDGGESPTGPGTFTAKVDGANFTGMQGGVIAQNTDGALVVNGSSSESATIQIMIPAFDGVGTYPLTFMNIGTYGYIPDPSNPDPATTVLYSTAAGGGSGEVNIATMDGSSVTGTFSFKAANLNNPSQKVNITDGEFNIMLTQ